jgi:hypothetical protein
MPWKSSNRVVRVAEAVVAGVLSAGVVVRTDRLRVVVASTVLVHQCTRSVDGLLLVLLALGLVPVPGVVVHAAVAALAPLLFLLLLCSFFFFFCFLGPPSLAALSFLWPNLSIFHSNRLSAATFSVQFTLSLCSDL